MDDLIDAVIDVIKTRKARDEAYARCEYEAGYWCQDETDDADRAKARLESELRALIRETVTDMRLAAPSSEPKASEPKAKG